jgi:hypothetical protein
MPYLLQILLPLYDNQGQRFSSDAYSEVRSKLVDMFGGLTSYTRAPAEGVWESGTSVKRDDVIVVEVMVGSLDRSWWGAYREDLERAFRQEQIVIRAQAYEPL